MAICPTRVVRLGYPQNGSGGAGRFWKHRNVPLLQPDETDIRGWQCRDPTVSGDDLTKRSQHHGEHFECFNEF